MAWEIWKDVLGPGAVRSLGRTYRFKQDDIRTIIYTGSAQILDGWTIPVTLEHVDAVPTRRPPKQDQQGVIGSVKRFALTSNWWCKALLTGSHQEDYERLMSMQYVSPEVQWGWLDTSGKVWRGPSITHVAITATPLQTCQHPFGVAPDTPYPDSAGLLLL